MQLSLKIFIPLFIFSAFFSCAKKQEAEFILLNGNIYTVNEKFDKATAMAISDGKILAIGSDAEIKKDYVSDNVLDLEQKPVYPGFYDAHCHFFGYSGNLRKANLKGAGSLDEVVERVIAHRQKYPDDTWILGRGWDQNLWELKEFPRKDKLDSLFPNIPVMLTRVDGHAVLVNQKTLDLAEITPETVIEGGQIVTENGECTGVLIDNAEELINAIMPVAPESVRIKSWKEAEANCLAVGLTTLVDAGLPTETIFLFDSLQQKGEIKIKLYPMLQPTDDGFEYAANKGMYKSDRMNVRSFKVYGDGALGSRGACLLHPYTDDPENTGFLLNSGDHFRDVARRIHMLGFQMNTHAIGDSANRTILDIYLETLKGRTDHRWRIEHAQVLDTADFDKFGKGSIIPSVQPTHCTSDMDWADERLGPDRMQFAYAYKTLLNSAGILALGSDFPVEEINPLLGFHAAIARVAADGHPAGGFQMKDALTREEALKGMTIWAAYSSFEEDEKGSLEAGKWADFVVLDKDIMRIDPKEILRTRVEETWINGERVFSAN